MKLLFFNHNVAYTGTFFRAFHLARCLVRNGHEVTVITTSEKNRVRTDRYEKDGVHIVEMPDMLIGPGRTGWDPANTLRRFNVAGDAPIDVIYAFDSRPAVVLPALFMRRRMGVPLVMDWADWWGRGGTIQDRSGPLMRHTVGPIETWFEESFRTHADATTVISRALGERATQLGVDPSRILRYPMGCNPPAQGDSRAAARERLGVPSGARVLLHIGVAVRADAALLFDGFRHARRSDPRLTLALVGNFRVDTPPDLASAQCVPRPGIVPLEVMRDWLTAADVCVVPLRDTIANRGRWPSKINEYLTAGRRVLITDVGDAAEYVRKSGAGSVTRADAEALGDGMTYLLDQREPERAAGEQAARGLAAGELSWARISTSVERFLKETPDH